MRYWSMGNHDAVLKRQAECKYSIGGKSKIGDEALKAEELRFRVRCRRWGPKGRCTIITWSYGRHSKPIRSDTPPS
jgi:hypothetical protein